MTTSSGNSSGATTTTTTVFLTLGSEDGDFTLLMNQRKRKRMESNRESARRSRMRKQMHLNELAVTKAQLTSKNACLATGIAVASGQLAAIDAENSILRAQLVELSRRLDSLNDILSWVRPGQSQGHVYTSPDWFPNQRDWNSTYLNQPIAAAATSHDMLQY
ncbi:hypothetical protein MLD38_034971 [Melastoma candidum]|uniref:Uncharacterized protein n=1 Tax=Melastoma candidum TaxID=119954 RepID=A0ACB9MC68_9MYRT|nr:hypothetical protein MLD38_034971 [Melastoma candidum]